MLKNLDPLLTPDLLHVLRSMGHGDEIALVDANFPAVSCAAATGRPLIRLDGASVTQVLEAVLTVLPLDDFEPESALRMQMVEDSEGEVPVFALFRTILAAQAGPSFTLGKLERHDFYARAKTAFAVVGTGEQRLYGNIILKKGIVRPL